MTAVRARYNCVSVFCNTRLLFLLFLAGFFINSSVYAKDNSTQPLLTEKQLGRINEIVEKAVREGKTPGGVVLIGNNGQLIYRKAFGYRSLEPEKINMTEDTIFDIASLTKVIATSTAVMQLVEKGKIGLDAPAAKYWPALKKNGKSLITIRQLLTHYSGLRPDLNLYPEWSGYKTAMKKIVYEKPMYPPGSRFLYSDINFEILGEIIRRVTGLPLDKYCTRNIFKPLGMKDTGFKPLTASKSRIAPTQYRKGKILCGNPHDPSCYSMGGVAGHAGLFSTVDDLSTFSQMMLNKGSIGRVRILKPETVEQMSTPQSPPDKNKLRGIGWDIEPPFSSNARELPSVGSYGHLGYTGTALWIDPVTRTYIIILTNRVHPNGKGDVKELRAEIKKAVSDTLGPLSNDKILSQRPSLAPYLGAKKSNTSGKSQQSRIQTGIDVLSNDRFSPLAGLRIGIITNHTGTDSSGRRTIDLLYNAPEVKLKAVFSPEHGLYGTEDKLVPSAKDNITGLPVYSLYGNIRKPTDKMIEDLDALVFDMQDAGVRFYTYITTMGYAMEAAAKKGIAFYVLDRPNPITASFVQGPIQETHLKSFTAYFPLPVRHGMTTGELAGMFNSEYRIGARLQIIKMNGYKRTEWYDETGLPWINPSPNLRTITGATLYPGVGMSEGANVSVGRGTETPFEILGAPWINAEKFSSYLNSRGIPGVTFAPVDFTPDSSNFKNRLCHGVRIELVSRQLLDPAYLGIEIISALYQLYPKDFRITDTQSLVGAKWVLDAIRNGEDPLSIKSKWQEKLDQFLKLRAKHLIYPITE